MAAIGLHRHSIAAKGRSYGAMRKEHWTLAPYPLERHSFTHPDSWYDEYRRIYDMFEKTLK